jgi:two-component sensor histidine kinase
MGAVTLAYTRPDRHYAPADLLLAKDMAERIALAVENAQLYRAAQQEIEERKRAEARIQELNEQLQMAMTETHHRVKNNLQLISAMLDMRLMDGEPSIPATEISRLSSSVRTLAVIHDLLTKTAKENGNTTEISARSALSQLLSTMQSSAGGTRLEYVIDDIWIPTRQCTSLALITNELVSNGVKHGKDHVAVSFRLVAGMATLDVRDNGSGFPPGFDARKAANTGLDLVDHLTKWDLQGSLRFANGPDGGGAVRIDFAVPAVAANNAET